MIAICGCLGPAGLSNLRVSVPSIVLRGDTTSFNCSWDLEPVDKIWAVKASFTRINMRCAVERMTLICLTSSCELLLNI